jgi:hypothetical protein
MLDALEGNPGRAVVYKLEIHTLSLRGSEATVAISMHGIATPCSARFAMTRIDNGNRTAHQLRLDGHRVPQAKPEKAKRCLRDPRSRVLFAPVLPKNAGNPKGGVTAATRHPGVAAFVRPCTSERMVLPTFPGRKVGWVRANARIKSDHREAIQNQGAGKENSGACGAPTAFKLGARRRAHQMRSSPSDSE